MPLIRLPAPSPRKRGEGMGRTGFPKQYPFMGHVPSPRLRGEG